VHVNFARIDTGKVPLHIVTIVVQAPWLAPGARVTT
jgi:hypothetical protein